MKSFKLFSIYFGGSDESDSKIKYLSIYLWYCKCDGDSNCYYKTYSIGLGSVNGTVAFSSILFIVNLEHTLCPSFRLFEESASEVSSSSFILDKSIDERD